MTTARHWASPNTGLKMQAIQAARAFHRNFSSSEGALVWVPAIIGGTTEVLFDAPVRFFSRTTPVAPGARLMSEAAADAIWGRWFHRQSFTPAVR